MEIGLASVLVVLLGKSGAGPCDALVDYLREGLAGPAPVPVTDLELGYARRESRLESRLRSTSPAMPRAYFTRVTPACRALTRRGSAPAATEAARAWTQRSEPGFVDRGRIFLCTLEDPEAVTLHELEEWMSDADHPEAGAVCASELATWPLADGARAQIFARAVRRTRWSRGRWEIEEAVVAAANAMGTPELREQLAPVLVDAHARRAVGYDRLRAAVCADDGTVSVDQTNACATLPAAAEDEWSRGEGESHWPVSVVATVAYAGLVAAAPYERNNRRNIPTTAGVVGGALVGVATVAVVGMALSDDKSEIGGYVEAFGSLGVLAGGVLGGVAAHALADSPGARAGVTAVGLAPLYLVTFAWTLD
jgi:hypothetical protein